MPNETPRMPRRPAWPWLLALLVVAGTVALWAGRARRPGPGPAPAPSAVVSSRAGTDSAASGAYAMAVPGRPYRFPRDHAAHPEYATEWWYYTGHLADAQGRRYGYQLTFFRVGVAPDAAKRTSRWAVRDLYFAHLALTDESERRHYFFDRISRGSLGEAGAETERYSVFIGDWTAALSGEAHVLKAVQNRLGVDLRATPVKPPVIHGTNGVSQKAEGKGRASYYYSYTRMATEGYVTVNGKRRAVRGESWFDHEFGSNQLARDQVGWDWFSLQMEDGTEAMLYLMRTRDGGADPYSSGTLVNARGESIHLRREDYRVERLSTWKSPTSGASYPSAWRVTIPAHGWDVDVKPTLAEQELTTEGSTGITYWEGSVTVAGQISGRPAHGRGYVELTGYAQAFRETF